MSTIAAHPFRILLLSLVFLAGWFTAPAAAMRDLDRQLIEAVQGGNAAQVKALLAERGQREGEGRGGQHGASFR